MKTILKAFDKTTTQRMIKSLRDAGLNVEKYDEGYRCKAPNGEIIFKATHGAGGYLVRMPENLFV